MRRGSSSLLLFTSDFAEIAQLVEHNLAKVRVASSSLVFRSKLLILRFVFTNGTASTLIHSIFSNGEVAELVDALL